MGAKSEFTVKRASWFAPEQAHRRNEFILSNEAVLSKESVKPTSNLVRTSFEIV